MRNRNRKKKHQRITDARPSVRKVITSVFILIALFVAAKSIQVFLQSSHYFTIKNISYCESLKVLRPSIIENLKGKNIFSVNLKEIQRKLQKRYPQCAQVRLSRRLPDSIVVVAQQRRVFTQTTIGGINVILDREGIVLSTQRKMDDNLPVISGLRYNRSNVKAGERIKSRRLSTAIRIIDAFLKNEGLTPYYITQIDVHSLSAINMYISGNVKVIIDGEDIDRKIHVLGLVLKQIQSQLDQLKYIDMRFKEPVVRKR